MNEEYKNENINLIKTYLSHIIEMFETNKVDLVQAIHYEHFFYYEIYLPLLKEFKEESRYEE